MPASYNSRIDAATRIVQANPRRWHATRNRQLRKPVRSLCSLVMTPQLGIEDRITDIISGWDGVEVTPHRFGGVEFRIDKREIGHLHGQRQADLPFPIRLRRDLVASGRAEAHALLPDTGWVSYRIRSEHDIPAVVELFRMNYDRLRGLWPRPAVRPLIGNATMLYDRTMDELPA
jgi:hypothetical protein